MFSVRSTLGGTIELESLIVLTQYNIAAENSGYKPEYRDKLTG